MRGFLAGAATGLVLCLGAAAMIGPPEAETAPGKAVTRAPMAAEPAPGLPPALADLPPEDLRALIHAGEVQAVSAALAGLSSEGIEAQKVIRNVFAMFAERHPKTVEFTEKWLEAEPQSVLAMAARGWALHAEGWAMRGSGLGRETSAPAMAALHKAHTEGLALMQAALAIDPGFLPASDGVLAMAYTTGQPELIEPEVARIMGLRPNRGTLSRAGQGLAPNWGGSTRQMKTLCRVYAPLVTDRPGYDAEVCFIDGTMMAGYLQGDDRATLAERIRASDNPLIAEWAGPGDVPGDSPSDRLAYLDGVKLNRPLSYDEARLYDQDAAQVAVLAGEARAPEFPAALARQVEIARSEADAKPGDWQAVARYLNIAAEDRQVNGTKADRADLFRRQVTALRLLPYEPKAWSSVGQSVLAREASSDEMAALEMSEPYLVNAAAYSNHQSQYLTGLVAPKLSLLVRTMSGQSQPFGKLRWQGVVQCPLVRQLRLLMAACEAEGMGFGACTGLPYEAQNMQGLIRDISGAGACKDEASAPLEDLAYNPVEVALPQD